MALVQKTNHVAEAIDRPIEKLKSGTVMQGTLTAFVEQIQDLENSGFELLNERGLLTAVGAQLDGVGAIVGEDREGRSDDEYRLAIRVRILRNLSDSTPEDILTIFNLYRPGSYKLEELPPASLRLTPQEALTPSDPTPQQFAQLLADIRGAGIGDAFIYGGYDVGYVFQFASGDALESSALKGFGNDTGTTGGHWYDIAAADGTGEVTILWTLAGEILRTLADDVLIV